MKNYRIVKIDSELIDEVLDSPKLSGTYGIQNKVDMAIRMVVEVLEYRQACCVITEPTNAGNVTVTTFDPKSGSYEP